jgi:hypothetical protein
MEIVSKAALKKMMLEYPNCPYTVYVNGYTEGFKKSSGAEVDTDTLAELPIPPCTYVTYVGRAFPERGRADVPCHIITGSGEEMIFHVDLAFPVALTDLYFIQRNVPVVLLEKVNAADITSYLADPECAQAIEDDFNKIAAPKRHLTLVHSTPQAEPAVPKKYRWYFTGNGRMTHTILGHDGDKENGVALALYMEYDPDEPVNRAHSRIRSMAISRLTAILADSIEAGNEESKIGFWLPQLDEDCLITLCESIGDGTLWIMSENQPQ